MSELRNFIRKDLGDGYVVCEDVHLPLGMICTVYIGPGKVYVLSRGSIAPADHLRQIQKVLGSVPVRLYLLAGKNGSSGLYDPDADVLSSGMDAEALTADIEAWLREPSAVFDETAIERMIAHIRSADIKTRGYVVQDSGKVFLLRHGTLTEASPHSPDLQYYLTLFSGTLGLHRFALGKITSGLIYLFTGGFFLAGWILDLMQLFAGSQKDSRKRYLFPMQHRLFKLCILPIGLLTSFALFSFYVYLVDAFSNGLLNIATKQIRNTDPVVYQNIIDAIVSFASR